jgi:hypothetical protein
VEQRSDTFWKGIHTKFIETNSCKNNIPNYVRTVRGVQNRWVEINKQCKKFAGIFARKCRLEESVETEFAISMGSVSQTGEICRKPFLFIQCWRILKQSPKRRERSTPNPGEARQSEERTPMGRSAAKRKREEEERMKSDSVDHALLQAMQEKTLFCRSRT